MDRRQFLRMAAEAGAAAALGFAQNREVAAASPDGTTEKNEVGEFEVPWGQLEAKMQRAAIMEKSEVFALHIASGRGEVATERFGNGRSVDCLTISDDHFIRRHMGNNAEREKAPTVVKLSHTHPLEAHAFVDDWQKASIREKTARQEMSSFRPLDPPSLIDRHSQGDAFALFEFSRAFGRVSNMETRFYVYGPSGERWEMKIAQPPAEIWKRFAEVHTCRQVLVNKLSEQANKKALDYWNALAKRKGSKGFWDAAEQFGKGAQDKFPELAGVASEAEELWGKFYGDHTLLFERAKDAVDKLRAESVAGSLSGLQRLHDTYRAVGLVLELTMPTEGGGLLTAKK